MKPLRDKSGTMTILQSGAVIAPVAAFTVSLLHAVVFCFSFLIITFLTVLLTSFLPHRIPFSVRIVLYSVTGSLVYIPAAVLSVYYFPQIQSGIYIPLLSAALYLTASRNVFFPRRQLMKTLLRNLMPECIAALLIGALRELLGSGSIGGKELFAAPLPFLLQPAGGLILLVILLTTLAAMPGKEAPDADCL